MKNSAFERIIARLVKELLDENECIAVFQDNFEKARREDDKVKMDSIDRECGYYRRKIEFVKSLLEELTK